MRVSFILLALITQVVACDPGPDPALGPCNTRKPASCILGTGEDEFEPINGSIVVQNGPAGQGVGSSHIWFALRCKNTGPHVLVEMGVDDVLTALRATPPLREALDLEYNSKQHADDAYGIRAFLAEPDPYGIGGGGGGGGASIYTGGLQGRQVKLWAKVDDLCNAHVEPEVVATVTGYHQL